MLFLVRVTGASTLQASCIAGKKDSDSRPSSGGGVVGRPGSGSRPESGGRRPSRRRATGRRRHRANAPHPLQATDPNMPPRHLGPPTSGRLLGRLPVVSAHALHTPESQCARTKCDAPTFRARPRPHHPERPIASRGTVQYAMTAQKRRARLGLQIARGSPSRISAEHIAPTYCHHAMLCRFVPYADCCTPPRRRAHTRRRSGPSSAARDDQRSIYDDVHLSYNVSTHILELYAMHDMHRAPESPCHAPPGIQRAHVALSQAELRRSR